MKGLFINPKAAQCSIYESGIMIYETLKRRYALDYKEASRFEDIPNGYDFSVINYHFCTFPMDTSRMNERTGIKVAVVLEMLPNDPFVRVPRNFDEYMVIDPTMKHEDKRVNAFPRPLEEFQVPPYQTQGIPVIGSFGFGTGGKNFHTIVAQINQEFDRAIFKLNIPTATWGDPDGSVAKANVKQCIAIAKPGVEIVAAHNYMTKVALVRWCAANTINCFFYQRDYTGLSATTDQAISSGRPLLVSECNTFRHIHQYTTPFPRTTIKRAITEALPGVQAMKRDWSSENFNRLFAAMLAKHGLG